MAATADGLPPDGAVDVDAPDAGLRAALSAARSGAWEPAAELLARTRVDRDWDRRGQYSAGLAELALHHTGWFDEWRRVPITYVPVPSHLASPPRRPPRCGK
ncbi:hypothetical protein ACIRF8_31665 [Streptomyces sp. NPDC102406]|uniref:hypothetical protein n=1 Tax=Streptomyces sp. NPDC102406 TaxID=3366171 RepID=UPI00381AD67A